MRQSTASLTTKISIFDGRCHVFRRAGSPFYWCGFHFKGRYVRTSTKEVSLEAAKSVASKWYLQKQGEISTGSLANPTHTFKKVSESALKHYENLVLRGIRSSVTLEGIRSILRSRVMPFFANYQVSEIDNTLWHRFKAHILEDYPAATRGTLHQYKNAVRVVLNEAYRSGLIKALPVFKDEYQTKRSGVSRPWFNSQEYSKLHKAILSHANRLKSIDRLQYQHAMELYDYVILATNTGMRVGELNNLRFSDVRIVREKMTDKEVLIISNIKGKRGTGTCQSYYGAVAAFRRRVEKRNILDPQKSSEKIFLVHHRSMFNKILSAIGLKETRGDPPIKRDFVSLRATYICFRLLNGVPVYEVANNCRTSVAVIESSYARYLGGAILPNINRTKNLQDGWDR
jgi:hypothetical protein